MRLGISATSWILPKNLRTRLRPVNVCAIVFDLSVSSRLRRHPRRLPGRVRREGVRVRPSLENSPALEPIRGPLPRIRELTADHAATATIPGFLAPESP